MPPPEMRKSPETNPKDAGNNTSSYPGDGSFHEILAWHLLNGTRPDSTPGRTGRRWNNKEFGHAVGKSDRAVRNWINLRKGKPDDIGLIELALFGDNSDYDNWRRQLRVAYDQLSGADKDRREPNRVRVPRPTPLFRGRGSVVDDVVGYLIAGAPAVLVHGPGGIGKTQITCAAAGRSEVRERFVDRIYWVELDSAQTGSEFEAAIVAGIGMDPALVRFGPAVERLKRDAAVSDEDTRPQLLILDNLETPFVEVPNAVKPALGELLAIPGLSILASIRGRRTPSGVSWEDVPVEPLSEEDSQCLFLEIAKGVSDKEPELKPLLNDLGGLPLAITLVASSVRSLQSVSAVWADWQDTGTDVATDDAEEEGRLSSLNRSIELSLRTLQQSLVGPAARRLFSVLGQLPAGMSRAERIEFCGRDYQHKTTRALLDCGLAHFEEGSRDRLGLLPPVRRFAQQYSAPTQEDEEKWVSLYVHLATRGERWRHEPGLVSRLKIELPNLESAVLRAVELTEFRAEHSEIAGALAEYAMIAGTDLVRSLEAIEARSHTAFDLLGQAHCRRGLAHIARMHSHYESARKLYDEAHTLYRQVGDFGGQANCLRGMANTARMQSRYEEARNLYEEAQEHDRQAGSLTGQAGCFWGLADIARLQSRYKDAQKLYDEAQKLDRQTGNRVGQANCLRGLANIARIQSRFGEAWNLYDEAQTTYREIGHLIGQASCLRGLANIARMRSRYDEARNLYEEAHKLDRETGILVGEANCLKGLAHTARAQNRYEEARNLYDEAQMLYRQTGNLGGQANCLRGLANIARMQSRYEEAQNFYDAAQTIYNQTGSLVGKGNCLQGLANVARMQNQYEEAQKFYEEAQMLYRQIGNLVGESNCLKGLAEIARVQNDAATFNSKMKKYDQILSEIDRGQVREL